MPPSNHLNVKFKFNLYFYLLSLIILLLREYLAIVWRTFGRAVTAGERDACILVCYCHLVGRDQILLKHQCKRIVSHIKEYHPKM